jgi:hypothetical protein
VAAQSNLGGLRTSRNDHDTRLFQSGLKSPPGNVKTVAKRHKKNIRSFDAVTVHEVHKLFVEVGGPIGQIQNGPNRNTGGPGGLKYPHALFRWNTDKISPWRMLGLTFSQFFLNGKRHILNVIQCADISGLYAGLIIFALIHAAAIIDILHAPPEPLQL